MVIVTEKLCRRCDRVLPISVFSPCRRMKDGHLNHCYECANKDTRERRKRDSEKVSAREKLRNLDPKRIASAKANRNKPERIAVAKLLRIKDELKFPERALARRKTAAAIRSGALKKWPCEYCGEIKVDAHHPDYNSPLDVVWLCRRHHIAAHALVRAMAVDGEPESTP